MKERYLKCDYYYNTLVQCIYNNSYRDCKVYIKVLDENADYKMIEIYESVLNKMKITPRVEMPLGDQTIINNIKNDIDFDYIPIKYVVFGWTIFNKNNALFHHAIGSGKTKGKLNQITIIKNKLLI